MKKNSRVLYLSSLFILILLAFSAVFYSANDKAAFNFVKTLTASTVRVEVSQFDLNLDNQIRLLKAIGESLPTNFDTNNVKETSLQLARYGVLYNIASLYLIRKDGIGITYNNHISDFHFSEVYSLFTSGKSMSTGIEIPSYKEDPYFYVAVPIRIDGEVEYILKAYYNNQNIQNILMFPFIDDIRFGLVDDNGMAVTDSFSHFSDSLYLNNLTDMTPGFFQYYMKEGSFLVYHSPTSASGVYFFLEIPKTAINQMTRILKVNCLIFALVIILLCLILIYFLMKSENEQKKDIMKLTEKLKQSEARYQNAFNYKNNIAWEYNPTTKELSAVIKRKNGRTQEIKISNALENIINNKIVHPDHIEEFQHFVDQIYNNPTSATCIVKLKHTSGDYYWARLSFIISTDSTETTHSVLGLIEDISDIKEIQDKYDQEKQTLAAMTENAVSYYLVNISNGEIIEKKSRDIPTNILDKIVNLEDMILCESAYFHDKDDISKLKEACSTDHIYKRLEKDNSSEDFEYKRRSPSTGTIEWISFSIKFVRSSNNDVIIAIQFENIDNRKKQEMLLQRRAERDLLTDLYNKMTMSSLINDYLKLQRNEEQINALIMLDADNYKAVNDTFGHVFGDKVLIDIADSLKACVKQSDLVGRIGGDEFMVFLKDVRSKDDILSILKRISESLHHTYAEKDVEVTISASIGVAYVTPDIKSFQPLYKLADEALYDAKNSGKNCYKFAKVTE